MPLERCRVPLRPAETRTHPRPRGHISSTSLSPEGSAAALSEGPANVPALEELILSAGVILSLWD